MKLNRIYFLLQVEAEVSVVGEEAFSSPKARQLPPGTQISPMHSQQQQRLPQYREGGCKLSVAVENILLGIDVSHSQVSLYFDEKRYIVTIHVIPNLPLTS